MGDGLGSFETSRPPGSDRAYPDYAPVPSAFWSGDRGGGERRPHWGEDRVFYRSTGGHLASLPARWTNSVPDDPLPAGADGRTRFRVDDLIKRSALRLRLQIDGAAKPLKEHDRPCSPLANSQTPGFQLQK
ncbi:MAG: DUF5372 family protein [Planctomycetota bacterium]